MRVRVVVAGILLLFHSHQYAVIKGSETAVSVEAAFTFPAADADNRIAPFAWFRDGFSLEDATTTCTFQGVFPISNSVALNGGTLYLDNDLILSNGVVFTGDGSVHMGVYNLDFGKTNVTWDGNITWTMNGSSLSLYSSVNLDGEWSCDGTGEIKGHGHTLTLGNGGAIVVGPGSTLRLQNLNIESISGANIRCMADDSLLILDNVRWCQQEDLTCTFTIGALQWHNRVKLSGVSSFAYQTIQTSTIHTDASLQLDPGFTFSYDPLGGGNNCLVFEDSSAELILNNATLHATSTGLLLSKGKLSIKGDSAICSEIWEEEDDNERVISTDEGISFGDGISSSNDLKTVIRLGAQLRVMQGSFIYNNLLASSWSMENRLSTVHLLAGTRFVLNQSLDLGVGSLEMSEKTLLENAVGKAVTGAVFVVD